MTIAVLCYDTAEVDIIRNVPEMDNDELDNWLIEHCNYNLDEVYWMGGDNIRINNLTPEDFGH